ncbi:PPOX class F420-dependent oxidoreductase [Actinokineospora sp.]|uniref:PPOX class F420-dependent oxidoreductase n=1 Tax=Actinokineospora sp. TaxID=1872133 RepID=UPI004037E398
MGSNALTRLGDGKYLLVTTFKRDGTAMPTPVWVARDADELVFWTVSDSWKVKRIRNNGRVELAECDFRGNPTGDTVPGTARLLDAAGSERARKLIQRKYGLVGRITMLASKIRRGNTGTIGIAITPDTP